MSGLLSGLFRSRVCEVCAAWPLEGAGAGVDIDFEGLRAVLAEALDPRVCVIDYL